MPPLLGAPSPHHPGNLSFGGGHLLFQLPALQFPRFFRTPAVEQAVVPVAPAAIVAAPAIAAAPAVAAVPAIAAAPAAAVPTIAAAPQIEVAAAAPPQQILLVDEPKQDECEELKLLVQLLMAQLAQQRGAAAASQNGATPAANAASQSTNGSSAVEIQELRRQVNDAQRELQLLLEELQKKGAAGAAGAAAEPNRLRSPVPVETPTPAATSDQANPVRLSPLSPEPEFRPVAQASYPAPRRLPISR